MTQELLNARRLHTALCEAGSSVFAYAEMLKIKANSEKYTNDMNIAMSALVDVISQVSADNAAQDEANANAQEILDELEDEALEVVAEMEAEDASRAMLAELEAEAGADAEREEEEAELEAEIIARIEEENAAAVEAIRVQNVAAGTEVDDERFMDGINRAEGYLPPMSALSDAEVEEVERVLNDASPFPGCDTSGDVEGTSGASEPVQPEPADDTAASEAAAKTDAAGGIKPLFPAGFWNLRGSHVPSVRVDGATIFDYKPETD